MPNRVTNNVKLLSHTPNPEDVVAVSARLCYSPLDIESLKARVQPNERKRLIGQLWESGHLSTFEHVSFTFGIEGVSRTLLAQITRHRIASFSVQSQRYVSKSDFSYILPPSIESLGSEAIAEFESQMEQIQRWYDGWRQKLSGAAKRENANEDARFLLPGATETRMILTMNARELLHFFSLRCCNRAQWEIRDVAWKMLFEAAKVAPELFKNAGPGCLAEKCPEGKKTCGLAHDVKRRFSEMRNALEREEHNG